MIRPKFRTILARAVDEGIGMGVSRWQRKSDGAPALTDEQYEALCESIDCEVWLAIDAVLDVSDGEPDA